MAAVLWASYAALLGYFGGQAFEQQPWKGLLLALGVAFAITLGVEAIRYALGRMSRHRAR
jgi:membrane protein DedA with SNARE-associated domain